MASTTADTLARLRVHIAAGRPGPVDLLADAAAAIERIDLAAMRLERRDSLIRRAALLLPNQESGPWTRAGWLHREANAMSRTWHILKATLPAKEPSTPRECLHAARLQAELPTSQRQFFRVLCQD